MAEPADKPAPPKEDSRKELRNLLSAPSSNWMRTGELLCKVQEEGSWANEQPTFTEWVRSQAKELGVAPATLWHRLSAWKYLSDWTRDHKVDMPTRIGEDSVNVVRKISLQDQQLGDKLTQQLLDGKVTRKELTKTWKEVKASAAHKGTRFPGNYRGIPEGFVRAYIDRERTLIEFGNDWSLEIAIAALRSAHIRIIDNDDEDDEDDDSPRPID